MFPFRSEIPGLFEPAQCRIDRPTRQSGDIDDVKPVKVAAANRLQNDGGRIRQKRFSHPKLLLRSRRKHKAWGVSPRCEMKLNLRAREMGDSSLPQKSLTYRPIAEKC